MENAIAAALSAFPPQLVKTITCDRGTEFANWRRIEERLQPFPCRSRHAKTKPGVDQRQASQSLELPFSPGAMGL